MQELIQLFRFFQPLLATLFLGECRLDLQHDRIDVGCVGIQLELPGQLVVRVQVPGLLTEAVPPVEMAGCSARMMEAVEAALDATHWKVSGPGGADGARDRLGPVGHPVDVNALPAHGTDAGFDLIEVASRDSFLVFNSEDTFAEVKADGGCEMHRLPFDYPIRAVDSPEGDVYLSYGPHQSYWPTVYIWDAKNGVLTIDADDLELYDRRIPRQAHEMVLDRNGVLYFTQNNWGREEQFVGVLEDEVRLFNADQRLRLVDEVEREITQRILRYDEASHLLYLVRVGETDEDSSVLQVIEPDSGRVLHRVEVGKTATDLAFDSEKIYVTNFDSASVSVIKKSDFSISEVEAEEQPLKLCACAGGVYSIDHAGNRLMEVGGKSWTLPNGGLPDNIFEWNGSLVITSHSSDRLVITSFDPGAENTADDRRRRRGPGRGGRRSTPCGARRRRRGPRRRISRRWGRRPTRRRRGRGCWPARSAGCRAGRSWGRGRPARRRRRIVGSRRIGRKIYHDALAKNLETRNEKSGVASASHRADDAWHHDRRVGRDRADRRRLANDRCRSGGPCRRSWLWGWLG